MQSIMSVRPHLLRSHKRSAGPPTTPPSQPLPPPGTYHRLPGFPTVDVTSFAAANPKPREEVAQQLLQHMRRYPTLTATIAVQPGPQQTDLLVASYPQSVALNPLDGTYGVIARLAGAPAIKQAADAHPLPYAAPSLVLDHVHGMRIPGSHDIHSLAAAMREGGWPNHVDMLQQVMDDLPRGRRVALLVSGPSATGKTTLSRHLQELAKDRKVRVVEGDMYFRNWSEATYPRTPEGTLFWDSPDAMHMQEMASDIARLVKDGKADLPIFNFESGKREAERQHVELGDDDLLVIDSVHAGHEAVVGKLDELNLPHKVVYMDTLRPEDRLLRRIVRNYEDRHSPASFTLQYWDLTTYPGELQFVRPTLLRMDPAHDVFCLTHLDTDLGLTRAEIDHKVALLEQHGIPPTYQAFATADDELRKGS